MQVPGAEFLMNMTPLELNIERGHLLGDVQVEDRMLAGLERTYKTMVGPAKRGIRAPQTEREMLDMFKWYRDEYRKLPSGPLELEDQMANVIGRRYTALARLKMVDDLLRGNRNVRQRLR